MIANGAKRVPPAMPGIPGPGNTISAFLRAGEFFVDGYRRCGPAFRVQLAGKSYVVFTGEEALEFLKNGGEAHLDRHEFFSRYAEEMGDPDFVLRASGPVHKRVRRALSLGFSRQLVGPFVPAMVANTEALAQSYLGKTVSAMGFLTRVLLQHYGNLLANRSLDAHYRDAMVFTVGAMLLGSNSVPAATRWFPLYRGAKRRIQALTEEIMRTRPQEAPQDRHHTMLDALLAARDTDGTGLAPEALGGAVLHGFVGCMFYSSRMAGFLLYDLLTHPDLLARIRTEIDDVCGDEPLDIKMLRSLGLLRAALTESQRLHPVALVLPYDAKDDFEFEGYQIAKGTQILISTLTSNFSERYFRAPYRYDASRCLAPRNEHAVKGSMYPFGVGERTCNAIGLVETLILSTVATMLRRFEFAMTPADHVLQTIPSPLPSPGPGFKLAFQRTREPVVNKTAEERAERIQAAAKVEVDDTPLFREVLSRAVMAEYAGGETVIKQGDVAEHFFIVMEGTVDVWREEAGADDKFLARLNAGKFFGEIGLLKGVPRTATVKASAGQTAGVLVLGRTDFMDLVAETDLISDEIATLVRRRYLSSKLAGAIPNLEKSEAGILDDIQVRKVRPGGLIIRQGDPAEEFFIISRGHVEVIVTKADGTRLTVATLGSGEFFGEAGILQSAPRNATVKAVDAEDVEVLVIGRAPFEKMMADSPDALNDIALRMAQRVVRAFKK
jgi:CRP-like cAMP-binding protein/cytochrome P450